MTTRETKGGDIVIYVFNNGGSPGWYRAVALCECGDGVAGHVCSDEAFMGHDMGFTSDWKHEAYDAHMKEAHEGAKWRLEWVPTAKVVDKTHEGLARAIATNQAKPREETEARP